MPKYIMLAFNGPTGGEGDGEALEQWYEQSHLPELKAAGATDTARRFKVVDNNLPGKEAWPYVAVYEIEADDMADLQRRMQQGGGISVHPALDRSRSATLLAVQVSGDD